MKSKIFYIALIAIAIVASIPFYNSYTKFHQEFSERGNNIGVAYAYPPAVGILGNSRNCLFCHLDNGPWKDDDNMVIDILEKESMKSLKQHDDTFLIEANKNESVTVLTILGYKINNDFEKPFRNAWLYIDTSTIGKNTISKFAYGWDVNLPMSCRLVGDKLSGFKNADITSLPMTIQPLENAHDAEIFLQAMLTKGESIKENAKEGMIGNYIERKVKLKVK